MVLRPARCLGLKYPETSRASRFLCVTFIGWELATDGGFGSALYIKYSFEVCYCMRKFTIRRRFSEFLELQRELQRECQVQSGILEAGVAHKVLLGNRTARGSALAYFLNSVTNSMAERGLFSPRLMEWLGIDTIRVHAEEESCVAKLLDKPTCGPPWQIVDEAWLKLWRTFVMGGGLRIPPGKVDSSDLLQFVAGGQLKGGLRDPSVKWLRWGMPAVALDSSGKLSIKVGEVMICR